MKNLEVLHASFSFHRILQVIIITYWCIETSSGKLTKEPRNVVALVGSTQILECCTDLDPSLQWSRKSLNTKEISDIFLGTSTGFVNGFRNSRFNMSHENATGCYNLVITNIYLEDAGTYICADDYGSRYSVNAEILIIESFTCQELFPKDAYIGMNEFGLEPDQIQISCIINYNGSMVPEMIWRWNSPTKLYNPKATVKNANSTSSSILAIIAAKEHDRGRVTCFVLSPGDTDLSSNQVNWTSPTYKVYYALFSGKEVDECTANELHLECHPPCSVASVRYSNGSSFCEISYSSETHNKRYVPLRTEKQIPSTFGLNPSTEKTEKTEKTTSSETPSWIIGTISALLATAVVTVGFVVGILCYRRRNRTRGDHQTLNQSANVSEGNYPQQQQRIRFDANTCSLEFNDEPSARPIITINLGNISGNYNSQNINISQDQNRNYGSAGCSAETSSASQPLLRGEEEINTVRQISTLDLEKDEAGATGLAIIDDELFVASGNSSEVVVYDALNTSCIKRQCKKLNVKGIKDMVSCPSMKCLFILGYRLRNADARYFVILKVDIHGYVNAEWETVLSARLISITEESNVLVTAHEERRVLEFKPDGRKVRDLELKTICPNHAIKFQSDKYLISHGQKGSDTHGVIMVNSEGEIMKRFGREIGSGVDQLNSPMQLVVGPKGNVMMADSVNSRIILLSPDLTYKSTLLSAADGLRCPVRLRTDESNGRLLVGDYGTRLVRLFELKNI